MLQCPLAFKYVVMAVALSEINYYSARLHLPVELPILAKDITDESVMPPFEHYFHLRIDAKHYSFIFQDRLSGVLKLDDQARQSFGIARAPDESMDECMERASRMKYTLNTNDVYKLATNLLVAMDINVRELEARNPPIVNKFHFFRSNRGSVPSPLFTIDWHYPPLLGYDPSRVKIELSSITGELLQLRQENLMFNIEHLPLIKDYDRLAAITDEEFLASSTCVMGKWV